MIRPSGDAAVPFGFRVILCRIAATMIPLVSWGRDGAIRFWDQQGNPRPGGAPNAHLSGYPPGMVALADGLVELEGDSIRFWDRQGNPRPRLARKGDYSWIYGAIALGDRAVSWSSDGAIRFWNTQGEPLRRVSDPHAGAVHGVLAFGDRLVSWGATAQSGFGTGKAKPRPGGAPNAHAGGVDDEEKARIDPWRQRRTKMAKAAGEARYG
jgi:hypothetical protein